MAASALLDGLIRAPRYEIASAILYRRVGAEFWREGCTVDMSRTGVLFRGPLPALPDGAAIEMILSLPEQGAVTCARVHCTGTIIRSGASEPDGQVCTTASIDDYEFMRTRTTG